MFIHFKEFVLDNPMLFIAIGICLMFYGLAIDDNGKTPDLDKKISPVIFVFIGGLIFFIPALCSILL